MIWWIVIYWLLGLIVIPYFWYEHTREIFLTSLVKLPFIAFIWPLCVVVMVDEYLWQNDRVLWRRKD